MSINAARKRTLSVSTLALLLVAALLPLAASPAAALPVTDVVISAGHTDVGSYNLDFSPSRTLLEDPANFGPAGTVVVDSLTVKSETTLVTASYLAGVHIFFDGWVWDSDTVFSTKWTVPELDALETWVSNGGVLITNEDREDADELGTKFGSTTVSSLTVTTETFTPANATHPINNGPFGTWTSAPARGTLGTLGPLSADWTVVANEGANVGIAVRAFGDGYVIITPDEGLFREHEPVPGDGPPLNETLVMNLFAYAISLTDDGNFPLQITDPGAQTSLVGDPASLDVDTTNGDGSAVTFSVDQLPSGLSLDPATGVVSGTPDTVGTTTVTITATPVSGPADAETFDWTVHSAVALVDPGALSSPQGVALSRTLGISGGSGSFAWSATDLPSGLSIDSASGEISGTPDTAGTSAVQVMVSDTAAGTSDTSDFDWTVTTESLACMPSAGFSQAGPAPGVPVDDDDFGAAMAAGDFNGDGLTDVAIGVPSDSATAGSVQIYQAPCGDSDSYRINQAGATPGAQEPGDGFGSALASGNFNGDAYDDLIVGIPGEDIGSRVDAGSAMVLYGSATGLTGAAGQLISQKGAVPGKIQAGDKFGDSLAVGDFNGDGLDDLLIGVPGEDVKGKVDAGGVEMLLGSPSGITNTGAQFWKQRGPLSGKSEANDRLGATVAAGDFNGDGFDDAALGVPGEDTTPTNNGVVHVLRGSGAGLTTTGQTVLSGAASSDRLGWSLATGEVTGDAFDDLLVGLRGRDKRGSVRLYGGSAGSVVLLDTVSQVGTGPAAAQNGDRFGAAVVVVDIDDDGATEVAIGVPREDIDGVSNAGTVQVFEIVAGNFDTATALFRTQADSDIPGVLVGGSRFGAALAAGDGLLVVGAPGDTAGTITGAGTAAAL